MQLVIKSNPVVCGAGVEVQHYRVALCALAGETVQVETDYLFRDQYNMRPIGERRARRLVRKYLSTFNYSREYEKSLFEHAVSSLSKTGLRVFDRNVARVKADARRGKQRCNWCGKCSKVGEVCPHCGKSEYLRKFDVR